MDQQIQDIRRAQLVRLDLRIQKYLGNSGVLVPFEPERVIFRDDRFATVEIRNDFIVNFHWGIGESGRRVIKIQVVASDTGSPLLAPIELDQEPALTASSLRAAISA